MSEPYPFTAVQHSKVPNGHIHKICNWNVNYYSELSGLILTSEDLYKVVYIADTEEFLALVSVAPVLWKPIGNNGIFINQVTVTPTAGTVDCSSSDYRVFNILVNQNITTVNIGTNAAVNFCLHKTLIFWQQGTGGYTINNLGFGTLKWENGMLPLFDTSNGGVTSIELMMPYGQSILGVQ